MPWAYRRNYKKLYFKKPFKQWLKKKTIQKITTFFTFQEEDSVLLWSEIRVHVRLYEYIILRLFLSGKLSVSNLVFQKVNITSVWWERWQLKE